jgi:isopentenyl phosphate kinase
MFGLPAVTLSPFSMVTSINGDIIEWDISRLNLALKEGLLPVIHGDVAFDQELGGTILSTEDLFSHLAGVLHPTRILLAGIEAGIWKDFPQRTHLINQISTDSVPEVDFRSDSSRGKDVTGGMRAKVHSMLQLVKNFPSLEVLIFSGERQENILSALMGGSPGTLIHY